MCHSALTLLDLPQNHQVRQRLCKACQPEKHVLLQGPTCKLRKGISLFVVAVLIFCSCCQWLQHHDVCVCVCVCLCVCEIENFQTIYTSLTLPLPLVTDLTRTLKLPHIASVISSVYTGTTTASLSSSTQNSLPPLQQKLAVASLWTPLLVTSLTPGQGFTRTHSVLISKNFLSFSIFFTGLYIFLHKPHNQDIYRF